jgi:hypothetical protein
LVESNERVALQVCRGCRCSVSLEVLLRRVHSHLDVSDPTRNQQLLAGPGHAHGDIRLSLQQILQSVTEHEFDLKARMFLAQARHDGRKNFDPDHFTRCYSDDPTHTSTLACGRSF